MGDVDTGDAEGDVDMLHRSMCMSTTDVEDPKLRSNVTAMAEMHEGHGICLESIVHNQTVWFGFKALELSCALAQLSVATAIMLYIRRNKKRALNDGSAAYANRLVLPAYQTILYMYCAFTAVASTVHLVESAGESLDDSTGPINKWLCATFTWNSRAILVGVQWGLFHIMFEGTAFFLMQKGAGWKALRFGLFCGLVVGVTVFAAIYWAEYLKIAGTSTKQSDLGSIIYLVINIGLFSFYAIVRCAPSTLFFRRPALRAYASFW
jgi:hypothetical protein